MIFDIAIVLWLDICSIFGAPPTQREEILVRRWLPTLVRSLKCKVLSFFELPRLKHDRGHWGRRERPPTASTDSRRDRHVLFLAVFLGVRFHGLFGVRSRMTGMTTGCVSVVCRLFVVASCVMLRGFLVMTSRMGMVF
jgi:hypothetical protein